METLPLSEVKMKLSALVDSTCKKPLKEELAGLCEAIGSNRLELFTMSPHKSIEIIAIVPGEPSTRKPSGASARKRQHRTTFPSLPFDGTESSLLFFFFSLPGPHELLSPEQPHRTDADLI